MRASKRVLEAAFSTFAPFWGSRCMFEAHADRKWPRHPRWDTHFPRIAQVDGVGEFLFRGLIDFFRGGKNGGPGH